MGWLILVFIVITIWGAVASANAAQKRLREAKEAYDRSLAELKRKPTNPDLKQRTLALGRAYSNLTRQHKGVTLYDEVALSNDINAACAGATAHVHPSQQPSVQSRLQRLAELRQQGLLSDEEFQAQRARILQEL